ncbi:MULTISPECIES: IS21 family transposase [unclassified Undibacterium]|uniref:IS21 family transposase n=1 Tax=unclassified Undibacterium TaxID=2630295 RepID=UPI003C2D9B3E
MINVSILSKIRRWHFREQISLREIARRTGLSRNTIRHYLKEEIVDPVYPQRHTPSKLDTFADKLAQWLFDETKKSRKQRRSLKQIHSDLCALGYDGSYDRIAAFARHWREEQIERNKGASKHTYIPLQFAAGEAFQFDWSEDWAMIAGERVKLQVAHFKLSHSRAFFVRAYLLQTHEMLFDAHHHAFVAWGGIPRRGIYDNMKTAVDKVKRGKARDVNARFAAMVSHYLFDAEFCNPASGWEKGQIEKNVQDARRRLWQKVPPQSSLVALNQWLAERCRALWEEVTHPTESIPIHQAWLNEQKHLMPVGQAFDGFVEHTKRISPTCLITFERNRYSVPASFANRPVSLHVYADRLLIIAEGKVIAEHQRLINRHHLPGYTIYDWRHYLSVLQRKPGAIRNGAPFAELPQAFQSLQSILLKRTGGDREMVDVLALVLLHDEQTVLTAVQLALETGAASKQIVLNILSRLLEGTPIAPVDVPQALVLQVEPKANVTRYDSLRNQGESHAA